MSPDNGVELGPLIPAVTAQLALWGEVLEERHPGDGAVAFARLCREEGLEPPKPLPPAPEPTHTAAVEAFCATPGDGRLLRALAEDLVARDDPMGAHLLRALALENAPTTEASAALAQAGEDFEKANRQSLVRLIWPVALQDFALGDHVVSFLRGLPTHLHLAVKDLGRFSRAQWTSAPVSAIRVTLVGHETLDADFIGHPLFAKATSLSIGFMTRPTLDLGPLLARPGAVLESVHVEWTGKTLRQLAKLPSPAALTRLSLGCPLEGKKPLLTAQHIEALALTGWPADVLG